MSVGGPEHHHEATEDVGLWVARDLDHAGPSEPSLASTAAYRSIAFQETCGSEDSVTPRARPRATRGPASAESSCPKDAQDADASGEALAVEPRKARLAITGATP